MDRCCESDKDDTENVKTELLCLAPQSLNEDNLDAATREGATNFHLRSLLPTYCIYASSKA